MKKRNPLKGLAKHEAKVSSKPVRAKVKISMREGKPVAKPKRVHKKKERNNEGGFNMAELKREFMRKYPEHYK